MKDSSFNRWFTVCTANTFRGIIESVVRIVTTVTSNVGNFCGLKDAFYRVVSTRRRGATQLFLPRVVCERVGGGVVIQFPRLRRELTANSVFGRDEDVLPGIVNEERIGENVRLPSQPFNFFKAMKDSIRGRIICA